MTRFDDLGPNSGLVEELYQRYLENPASVDEHWRAYFSGATPPTGDGAAPAPAAPPAEAAPAATPAPAAPTPAPARPGPIVLDGDEPEPLRGAAARIVENMEASLGVPTATSVRAVPAKLLEVNRQILNNQLARTGAGKVSFTHLIGFAVLRALARLPRHELGLRHRRRQARRRAPRAREPRARGRRAAARRHAHAARAEHQGRRHPRLRRVLRRVRGADRARSAAARSRPTTSPAPRVTITNPGTIGTVHSVPRLMPGQGVIVGVGAIGYPAEYEGADPPTLAELGVSKVDHAHEHLRPPHHPGRRERRVPAAHPRAAARAATSFYDDIFASLGVPYEPARWHDGPQRVRRPGHPAREGRAGPPAHQHVPRARAPHREPRPARASRAADAPRARHHAPRPHDLGPRPRVPDRRPRCRPAATQGADAPRHPRRAARRVRAHHRRRVHAHPGARPEGVDPGAGRRRARAASPSARSAASSSGSTRPRRSSASCTRSTSGRSASASKARRRSIPMLDALCTSAADAGHERRRDRHGAPRPAQRARQRRRQVVRADLPRVRGRARPASTQGSGDVKYHLGATGKHESPSGNDVQLTLAANPSHLEAVDPVVEGMARANGDAVADARPTRGAAGADPRRRRVRRPGRRRRDAQPLGAARLRRRRHRAHRRQQPARVHHRARARPLDRVRHRHRQDGAGADLPRERRRPRGRGAGRSGSRSSSASSSRRTSSSTWSATGATATTRPTSPRSRSRGCTS